MTVSDTHADTIREALDTLRGGIRFSEDREWVEAEIREITEAADALVAERDWLIDFAQKLAARGCLFGNDCGACIRCEAVAALKEAS